MPRSPADATAQQIERAFDDIAHQLQAAAKTLSGETEAALVKASKELTVAAESMRRQARSHGQGIAGRAVDEIKDHPIASLAATISAAATLVGIIAAARHKAA